jgi:hypothetical protein
MGRTTWGISAYSLVAKLSLVDSLNVNTCYISPEAPCRINCDHVEAICALDNEKTFGGTVNQFGLEFVIINFVACDPFDFVRPEACFHEF